MLISLLIAMSSIAATAWLAVTTTTRAVQQEQGQALSSDARIYTALLGYAAEHPTWTGVQSAIDELADRNDRRIWLTTPDRQLIAASRSSEGFRRLRSPRTSIRCESISDCCRRPVPARSIRGPPGRSCCPSRAAQAGDGRRSPTLRPGAERVR